MNKSELEKIAERICDHYCKCPEKYKKQSQLDRICMNCPLDKALQNGLRKINMQVEYTTGDLAERINEVVDAVNELKEGAGR